MDIYIFLIIVSFTFFSYSSQVIKLLKTKDSTGVSFNNEIVDSIAIGMVIFFSENNYVFKIAFMELLLMITTMCCIFIYRNKNEIKEKYDKFFIISIVSSFFMIFSLAQAIKSYNSKTYSNVSVLSYVSFIFLDLLLLFIVENKVILMTTIINLVIYMYIVLKTIKVNKDYNQSLII